MEGLVKGLLDVALGGGNGNKREEDEVNERSRSTSWANIVSGDQDDEQNDHRSSNNRRNEEGNYGRNAEWGSGGSQSLGRPQKNEEQNNDGWETVGKKQPKKQVHKENWDNFKRPADEQEYSNEVEHTSQMDPSQNELNDLGQACNKLWELYYNRLVPGKDYEIDCGEGNKTYQKQDMAGGSLFTWLGEDVLKKPTIYRFCSLLDNYNPDEGYKEQVTSQEKQEQAAFIEEICRTAPILASLWYIATSYKGASSCQITKSQQAFNIR